MRIWKRVAAVVTAAACALTLGIGMATAESGNGRSNLQLATLGGVPTMSSYVPISACRIVQTLPVNLTFTDGVTRSFYVGGNTGFEAQGGRPGGCGLPVGATAVAVSMQAYGGNQFGYLKSWAVPDPEPQSSVLTYQAGVQTSNGVTLALGATEPSLTIKSRGGATQVVIDVLGYYINPVQVILQDVGTAYASSNRVTAVTQNGVGDYTITVDGISDSCPVAATAEGVGFSATAYALNDTSVAVRTTDLAGVPVNAWTDVTIMC